VTIKYFISIGSVQNCVYKVKVSSLHSPFNLNLFEAEFLNTYKIFGLSHIKVVHLPVVVLIFIVGFMGGVWCIPNFSRKFSPPLTFPIFFLLRINKSILGIY
jgi:hypothetical protein